MPWALPEISVAHLPKAATVLPVGHMDIPRGPWAPLRARPWTCSNPDTVQKPGQIKANTHRAGLLKDALYGVESALGLNPGALLIAA